MQIIILVFKVKHEEGDTIEFNFCEAGLYVEINQANGEMSNFIIDHYEAISLGQFLSEESERYELNQMYINDERVD